MLAYFKAKFDLTEILSFNYDLYTRRLTVQGMDESGRLTTKQDTMTTMDAARLFRLHVSNLVGF